MYEKKLTAIRMRVERVERVERERERERARRDEFDSNQPLRRLSRGMSQFSAARGANF